MSLWSWARRGLVVAATWLVLTVAASASGQATQDAPTAKAAPGEPATSGAAGPVIPELPATATAPSGNSAAPSQPPSVAPAGAPEAAPSPTPKDDTRRSSGLYGDVTNVALRRTLVLITAFLIGLSGAAAFHLGVYTGFIASESRPELLRFLHTEFIAGRTISSQQVAAARFLRVFFWCFGGIVAVVFQMADADSLVPIQAFVLGASWPSVVTQLMSGRSTSGPPQRADIVPPSQAPGPPTGGQPTPPPPGQPPPVPIVGPVLVQETKELIP